MHTRQRAERAAGVGVDRAEHHDEEVGTPMGAEVGGDDLEVVAVVGPDGREPVDHVVAGVAAGAQQLAHAGDHLDASAQPDEPRDHGGGGLDRDLERGVVVGRRPHVEEHGGPRPPAGFVVADHEIAGACRRTPVHTAKVVADLVVAQRQEVVAQVARHRARAICLAVGRHAAPGGDGRDDVVDARPHRELGLAGAGDDAPSQAERVGGAHHERSRPRSGRVGGWGCGTRRAP